MGSTRLAVLVLVAAAVAACGGGSKAGHAPATLKGAGSSFVFPLVSAWQQTYDAARIDYSPIGSGGGIDSISKRIVDFGASDAPLTTDQAAACHGCVQIPWALSATSVSYRLDGAPQHLRVSGPVLADIYLGKVTRWNDPALARLNPGAELPETQVTPVFRSDSSGTTYNFTDYLSSVSPAWKSKVGTGTQVNFTVGTGGKGSSGVAAVLTRTNGAIGYVDVAYAQDSKLSYFAVENRTGAFVLPTLASIGVAASKVHGLSGSNAVSIVNPPGAKGYPICTFTYVILPRTSSKAAPLKAFVSWALTSGQQFGPKLLFEPLPQAVRKAGKAALAGVG
jgi:phosphate transport system substrate-binding protein